MRKFLNLLVLTSLISSAAYSQVKRAPTRSNPRATASPPVSAPSAPFLDRGKIAGKTYVNKALGLQITFPDVWIVANYDFSTYVKSKGIDLTPKPPKAANPSDQAKLNADFKRLTFVLTAYRSLPGTQQNATAHIAVEDIRRLNTNRPVKDAVDYVDLVRYQMSQIKLPPGYTFSETKAEKLGPNQFAYLDSTDQGAKERLYVTVRKGYAILLSLAYSADDDLETFRDVLALASFSSK